MASFAEIMQQMQPQQTPVPMPYVPGMPQGAPVQMPQVGPVDIAPQQLTPAPQAQQPQQPTQDPAEMEQRKAGWRTILGGLMAQPNAKDVLMQVGLKLMQGRQPGQSLGQQFGNAAQTGVMTNQMLKQNQVDAADKQRKQDIEDRNQGMKEQTHELDVRQGTANATKAEAANDFYAKTRGQAIEEIELGIENLKRKGLVEDAKLVEQTFQNGKLKEAWDLTRREKESSIWARTQQVDIQRKNANKVPAAGQARRDIEDLVKRANPQEAGESDAAYDQRIAQATLGMQQTSKTNSATDLLKLAELTEDDDERNALLAEADRIIKGRQSGTPAPATGRGGTKATTAEKANWIQRAKAANPGISLTEIQRRANEKFGN